MKVFDLVFHQFFFTAVSIKRVSSSHHSQSTHSGHFNQDRCSRVRYPLFHPYIHLFSVKTWRPHYPQCNLSANSLWLGLCSASSSRDEQLQRSDKVCSFYLHTYIFKAYSLQWLTEHPFWMLSVITTILMLQTGRAAPTALWKWNRATLGLGNKKYLVRFKMIQPKTQPSVAISFPVIS